ncbi:MAG: grasp-with-spasm system ATP-grasp peptide maturase [Bacteroidia bacterium]|nr:grasp-with-spasm system ATP-grasp peptide maturase [Bacteroidia bacterium]
MKMVLIISRNNDFSTSEVIKWLVYLKRNYIRINEDTVLDVLKLDEKKLIFRVDGNIYDIDDFESLWYRRSDFNFSFTSKLEYLNNEEKFVKSFIHEILSKKKDLKNLNNFNLTDISKLDLYLNRIYLKRLKLPPFILTQDKKNLLDFLNKHKEIISKPVFLPFFVVSNESYGAYTSRINNEIINKMPDLFTVTLFQKAIPKKFEIRVFYLDGKFYSMVIFSQKNKKTNQDYRNYDDKLPNRTTPFNLPNYIENELNNYLLSYGLNCASLDIIIDNNNDFYLIDVNPVGQFGMVSRPCNYKLEKKVASFLNNEK